MSSSFTPSPNRRRFFALAAGACAAGGWWRWQRELQRVTQSSHALGAKVTMTALHADEAVAREAVEAAFAELEAIEAVMSLYRPESELCRLNRDSVLEKPDARLVEVLRFAAQVSEKSGGAFDVTVQPLWTLKGAKADAETLARVDWKKLRIEEQRIVLEKGMAVTLNGIAQGYAADAAMRVLRAHGIEHALVDAGEFSARGANAKRDAWSIGIQHPREREAFAALARLENRCLATSGDYETAFSEDLSRHHIVNPHTGRSPEELASVSVLAPDAMTADALSTALFVLGAERGQELLREFTGTDALLITKDGRHIATSGFAAVA